MHSIADNKMQENKNLIFVVESFIYYQSTKIALFVGKTAKPLISGDRIFLEEGELCKVKTKLEILDLEKLTNCQSIDFNILGSFELKSIKGASVKQFTAESVNAYNEDNQRKIISF